MQRWHILFLAILLAFGAPAFAVEPGEMLSDPALEARARDLSAELRCLVCQNQSIDDSQAPLAKDLRLIVRERLSAGDSNDAIRTFLVQRYGDFILLKPPFKLTTLLLWLTPLLVLLAGGFAVRASMRHRRLTAVEQSPDLNETEKGRLAAIMDRHKTSAH